MSRKHVPVRLCAGCQARDAQAAMERFTLAQGALVWRRQGGRGAYLHARQECRAAFLARKPGLRSLRATVDKAQRAGLLSGAMKQ